MVRWRRRSSLVIAGFLQSVAARAISVSSLLICRSHKSKADRASFSYWSASTGGRDAGCCFVVLVMMRSPFLTCFGVPDTRFKVVSGHVMGLEDRCSNEPASLAALPPRPAHC